MNLKIAAIQSDLYWEDREKNLQHFSEMLTTVRDADLVILPEMFATGFSMQTNKAEDAVTGESVRWMQQVSAEKNMAVCGSLMVQEDGRFYNRFYFISAETGIVTYNKRHLFSLAGEEKHYTQGDQQVVVKYKNWNIGLQVCYDLRFPVWSRRSEKFDYDLLVYVANWPDRRSMAWRSLLPARAIENQAYVAGLNRVGSDGNNIIHSGYSVILDPMGQALAEAKPFATQILQAELQKEKIDGVRKSLGFYHDRDGFDII